MSAISRQAKAVASAVALVLVQVQVYVGQGGIETLQAVTLGQWISVVLGVAAGYGVVYAIPNQPAPVPPNEFQEFADALRRQDADADPPGDHVAP